MAAAGTLGAVGCPWPPSDAILLAPSPSSSDTTRMSSTTDPPSLSLSAKLNGSARRLATACSPRSSPCPSAPAATTSTPSPLASACPPLSPPSPVPAAAPSFLFCSSVRRPSCYSVSGLSGDEGDDTTTDAAEDVGEGGCGAGAACIRATSTLTPTSPPPPPPYLRTAHGGGAASAAGDRLDFGSGVRDIFLHTCHRVRVPSLAVSSLFYPYTDDKVALTILEDHCTEEVASSKNVKRLYSPWRCS